jgi:predicted Zn-dependent peptidase
MSTLPPHHETTLENGLRVVAIPMTNGSGVVSTDLFYNVGSRDEMLGKSGIAHMLEHMNFKSTEHLAEGEFDEIVKRHGGINNASTGFDYTHYFIKGAARNLSISLELFAELMAHLKLTDEEFQKERDVVAEERRWRTDNHPLGYLYFRIFNTHYTSHSYHWTPIGFMEDIQRWSVDDIRAFHRRFYRPDNAMLVVAGDIEPQEVFAQAGHHFGAITSAPLSDADRLWEHTPTEPPRDGARRVEIHKENTHNETIAILFDVPDFRHEDQVALSVLSEILSAGKSSRLHRALIHDHPLAHEVHAYNMELKDPGIFLFLALGNPDTTAETMEAALIEQIDRIKQSPVTAEELQKVKASTRRDFVQMMEGASGLSDLFGSYLIRGDLTPLQNYEANLDKITPKTIQEVANRYFDHTLSTTVILRKSDG